MFVPIVLFCGHLRSMLTFGGYFTLREHVIRPLASRGDVVSLVCAETEVAAEVRRELERRVWPELRVLRATYTTQVSQAARRAHCASEALSEDARRASAGAPRFTHFVHCRPDLVFARPIVFAASEVITTVARSVAGVGRVTTDLLTTRGCGPCRGGAFGLGADARGPPCALLTDQFAVVPRALVAAYFGAPQPRPIPPRPGLGGFVDALSGRRTGPGDAAACRVRVAVDAAMVARCPCSSMWAEGAVTKKVAAAGAVVCLAPLRFDIDDHRHPDMSLRRYEARRKRLPRSAWASATNLTC